MSRLNIKADDLRSRASDAWHRFVDLCIEHEIPASLGFIADCAAVNADVKFAPEIASKLSSGEFEIWNHGDTHKKDEASGIYEFCGRSIKDQVKSIQNGQDAAEAIFGYRPVLFGPPFNRFDANSLRALDQFPELTHIYDIPYHRRKTTIPKAYYVECEGPMNGRQFGFEKAVASSEPFILRQIPFVLQVHPGNHWTKQCAERFLKYIQIVRSNGYRIVLSGELFAN